MDTNVKQQIAIAAVTAAGPDASLDRVIEAAQRIASNLTEGSPVMTAIDYAANREGHEAKKPFTSTVIHVDSEVSSKRGIVVLQSDEGEREFFRTQIVPGNPDALALARRARELVGRQVTIYSHTEKVSGNAQQKVRVIDALVDRGPNAEVLKEPDAFAIDWEETDDDNFVGGIRYMKASGAKKLKLGSQGVQSDLPGTAA